MVYVTGMVVLLLFCCYLLGACHMLGVLCVLLLFGGLGEVS